MKTFPTLITLVITSLTWMNAEAQNGSPSLGGAIAKLFGEHQAFTATMEYEINTPHSQDPMIMPGKLSFDTGKSRFELNMADIKGSAVPPGAVEQLKSFGMDQTVSISRPDKQFSYIIYPASQSYLENPLLDKASAEKPSELKAETTELGKENVDGHDCVKNKVVVTGKDNVAHESIVWNAKDLKNFPVKIETSEDGTKMTMHFRKVMFEKPAASLFEVPAGFTKYSSAPALMQAVMMKQIGATKVR